MNGVAVIVVFAALLASWQRSCVVATSAGTGAGSARCLPGSFNTGIDRLAFVKPKSSPERSSKTVPTPSHTSAQA